MPKGKGMLDKGKISNAFSSDIETLEATSEQPAANEAMQRISITIPDEMLKAIDRHIFERKQEGISINRSRFICEVLEPKVKKLNQ